MFTWPIVFNFNNRLAEGFETQSFYYKIKLSEPASYISYVLSSVYSTINGASLLYC